MRTDGVRIIEFGATDYRPYKEKEREILRAALGRWPGEPGVEEAAEVVELAEAGCEFVQFDEPVLTEIVFSEECDRRTFM